MSKLEQFATPAFQTPIGLLIVLIAGLLFAWGAYIERESIDLLFFRLFGGNTRIGQVAATVVPAAILVMTLVVVSRLAA